MRTCKSVMSVFSELAEMSAALVATAPLHGRLNRVVVPVSTFENIVGGQTCEWL